MGAGGAARTMLNILNNIDRSEFTPILVTLNYDGSYEKYLDPNIKFIKLKTKRLRSAIFPLAKVIREERADLVFSTIPNYNTIAILGRLLSFTSAKNIVREAAYLGGTPSSNLKLRLYGLLYRFSSKVVALSNGVKENIVTRYKVKPSKIEVIYNPVDIENIARNIHEGTMTEEHLSIFTDSDKVIITAGRLVNDKDHKTLIKAFAKVNERVDSKLIILGEGELEQELRLLAEKLMIKDNVHFLGFQQNPYIYFKHADVFALTSKREGFGHVLTEALATGIPIVSTDAKPGAKEVLNSGEFGLMCQVGNVSELADKLYEILTWDENQINDWIEKGMERAHTFHAKKIVKQYEMLFSQVIEQ